MKVYSAYSNFTDHQRKPDKKTMRLGMTERDRRILEDIYLYGGVLTTHHIQALEFAGLQERQRQERLGRLFHNGFLNRTSKAGMAYCQTMVYWLTAQGAQEVAQTLDQPEVMKQYVKFPKFAEILHDMKIVDIFLVLKQACERTNGEFDIQEWVWERELRRDPPQVEFTTLDGQLAQHEVVPDGFVVVNRRVADRQDGFFQSRLLLEVDLSHHSNKKFARDKVLPGTAWIHSKAYQQQYGRKGGRWLVITKSEEREEYLMKTTVQAAKDNAVLWYFTTFERLNAETILTEPIWYRAGERSPVALFPPK